MLVIGAVLGNRLADKGSWAAASAASVPGPSRAVSTPAVPSAQIQASSTVPARPSGGDFDGSEPVDDPHFHTGATSPSRTMLIVGALLLVIVIVSLWRLAVQTETHERDSLLFRQTLRAWHPLMYGCGETPRSMKRCINRVRFFAMQQRANPAPSVSFRIFERWRGIRPAPELTVPVIPEDVLVPLAVIHHVRRLWLADDGFWNDPAGFLTRQADFPVAMTQAARDLSTKSVGTWRDAFGKVSAGVHV